ncbi:MAG TPA: SDR family NAD(P)-dependent oxidoreductase, partial [Gemmatimonadales bacterium]|nr:SDR family NAD(P)-dependent oxidoreductase [Gemmatimonadales bacterium]
MAGRVVVITGASSGIGAALALMLAERGHSPVLVARRDEALQAVADQCGPEALAITADVTERAEVRR